MTLLKETSKSDRKKRVVSIWRRELVNLNKTRDNHLSRFGKYFDHSLFIKNNVEIGSHVSQFGTHLISIKPGILGFIGFWTKTILTIKKQHKKKYYDAIILPIGEEPLAPFIYLLVRSNGVRPNIIFDMWDVPGLALPGTDRHILKKIARLSYLKLLPYLLRFADIVICGIEPQPLIELGVKKEKLIKSENGIVLENFQRNIRASDIWDKNQSVHLLYQGYVHPARGATAMLEAVSVLKKKGHAVNLLMVGPLGDLVKDEIAIKATELRIEELIKVEGPVPSEEIPSIIAGADICLSPLIDIEKFRWSYPVKIYEYMAMQKPVVASNLPGTARLIDSGKVGGLLYEPEDPNGISDAIAYLIENPNEREKMAFEGYKLAKTKSWKTQIGKLSKKLTESISLN